jgi:transcriptional regulator GlxA family with amidase domain
MKSSFALAGLLALAVLPSDAVAAALRVAFVISDGFDVMDLAGPWEVFQDVVLPAGPGKGSTEEAFELFTVAADSKPVSTAGGARVVPRYTFATTPRPDIVVIGAQSDKSAALLAWLRAEHADRVTLVSICTGARQLALAGLLDGKQATSHHEYLADFSQRFPKVDWQRSRRFVRADPIIYTAGGLTSGIDLALHIVAERFGAVVAQATADYLEYRGSGWLEQQ